MTQQEALNLRTFRTLAGPARKAAIRKHFEARGLSFDLDPHAVPFSMRGELADMAKAVGYRKSISSCLSLGSAFYVYLSRGAA